MKSLILMFLMFQLETALAGTSISLTEFLKLTKDQSPELAMEKSDQEAAQAKSLGIRLDPPMLGFMNMTESGSNQQGFELTQEIPFPSKIQQEKNSRQLEADSQTSLSRFREKEILSQARMAFIQFWQAFEKNKILNEKKSWIKEHLKIARATARADSTAQLHLLEIESEVDKMESDLLESQAELIEKKNNLKIYAPELALEGLIPLTPPLEKPLVANLGKPFLLEWKETELKSAEAMKSLKKQTYFPDLVFRYRNYQASEMKPQNEELMIGISLPFLFFWQSQSEVKEASQRQVRAELELKKARIEIENSTSSLVNKLELLKKQLDLLKDQLIPRAHKRMKLVENVSMRSMEGLDEHRNVMLNYLDLRIKEIELRMDYEKNFSELLKLTGSEKDL